MTVGLSTTGFEPKTLDAIQSEMQDALTAGISPTLNVSAGSVLGQLVGTVASQIRQVWEGLQALHASWDPDQASGQRLRAVGALTGTTADAAAPTLVACTVNVATGTYAPGTLVAYVTGDPTKRFENRDSLTAASLGNYALVFKCQENGPTVVNAGTLTQIAAPVTGWNSVTNAAEGSLGRLEETDSEFRVKREDELARRGSTSTDAIRADVLNVAGVTSCLVVENVGDVTVDGTPPRGIQCYVKGGVDADVAAAILGAKSGGIPTGGTTTINATDSQGVVHAVSFTRPTQVTIYVTATVSGLVGKYAGDAEVTAALLALTANLSPGRDVVYSKLFAAAANTAGVVDVTNLRVGIAPSPSGVTNVVIGPAEFADTVIGNILVTSSIVSGPP
jgi:uncharacterized phage protein gp47/JayE